MANMLDCGIIVTEFEFQLCYYIHFQTNTFGKGWNPFIPPQLWVKLYFNYSLYNDGFSIK